MNIKRLYWNISTEVLISRLTKLLKKQNAKLCCCNEVHRWFDKLLASASEKKQYVEKPSSIQTDVSSNTHSDSSTKRFKSAYSQATLHGFMNKKTK